MNYELSLELFRFDESGLGLGWDMSVPNWFGVKSIIKLKTNWNFLRYIYFLHLYFFKFSRTEHKKNINNLSKQSLTKRKRLG